MESAALAASIKYSAPIYVDPFQAVQMAQNLTKKGRRVIEYAVTSTSRPKLFLDPLRHRQFPFQGENHS